MPLRPDLGALGAMSAAALLGGCPAPRHVSGAVFETSTTTADGARALARPVFGANVTWTCPSGGPPPQSLWTDSSGRFTSKELHADIPGNCELVVTKDHHATFRQTFDRLCGKPLLAGNCDAAHVAVELRPDTPTVPAAILTAPPSAFVPLDAPPSRSGDIQTVFSVVLAADGTAQVDGKPVASDEDVLPVARAAHEKNPDLRAVIKADSAVPHGRVIHVLDLLKQAQIGKIAFGVSPIKAPGPP